MRQTESAGGVIRNARGEIALVHHDGWFWGFPKGHVDPGESIRDAAEREIAEEVGLTNLGFVRAFEPYTRIKGGDENVADPEIKTIHMFLFDSVEEQFILTDLRHDEARWVPIGEVANLLSHPKDKEWFSSIADSLK